MNQNNNITNPEHRAMAPSDQEPLAEDGPQSVTQEEDFTTISFQEFIGERLNAQDENIRSVQVSFANLSEQISAQLGALTTMLTTTKSQPATSQKITPPPATPRELSDVTAPPPARSFLNRMMPPMKVISDTASYFTGTRPTRPPPGLVNTHEIQKIRDSIPDPPLSQFMAYADDENVSDELDHAHAQADEETADAEAQVTFDRVYPSIDNRVTFSSKFRKFDEDKQVYPSEEYVTDHGLEFRDQFRKSFGREQNKAPAPVPSNPFPYRGTTTTTNIKRRDTMLGRLAEDADAITANTGVLYVRTPPRFDHIVLKKIYVEDVRVFIELVIQYQVAYKYQLPVATMLAPKVREEILAKYRQLTLTKFYQLSTDNLLKILQIECRPTTTLSFYEILKKHLKFEVAPGFRPFTSNYKLFYDELIAYKYRTLQYFELMSEDNSEAIPPITNREGGLIKLWADKVPFDYGQRVCKTIMKKVSSFSDFHTFLNHFYNLATTHFRMYEQARGLEEHFSKSTAMDSSHKASADTSGDKHASYNAAKKRIFNNHSNTNKKRYPSSSLHQVEEVPFDYDHDDPTASELHDALECDENVPYFPNDDNDQYPDSNDKEDDGPSDVQDSDGESVDAQLAELMHIAPTNNYPRFSDNKPGILSRNNLTSTPDRPNGCFQLLFNGSCKKGDKCTFPHDFKNLQRAHAFYLKQLQASKYRVSNASPAGNGGPAPMLKSFPHKLSLIEQFSDFQDASAHLPDGILQQLYFSANPEAPLFQAMFKAATLHVGDPITLHVPRVLFDTGALHGSYMSLDL